MEVILGMGMNNEFYVRTLLGSKLENIPNSGAILGIAIMSEHSGSFVDGVKIMEKDFEPGETAILEFTFKNDTHFLLFKNIKIVNIRGNFQQGNIKLLNLKLEKNNLAPQEATKITITLKSEESTNVRNYTILPELEWTPECVFNPKQSPTEGQGTFSISPK